MKRFILATITTLALSFTPVFAADFQKGWEAYSGGDYATALEEWTPLAEKGHASVQFLLGWMYYSGEGVPQDYGQAIALYTPAAEQGYDMAQLMLGVMYANGEGVAQDYKQAVMWYRLAAKQGLAKAQTALSFMYRNGKGVLRNYVKAHMWANIASANGDERGTEYRDNAAGLMKPADILKAQQMASKCLNSGYKNCDY